MIEDERAGRAMIAAGTAQHSAEADRGRHPGFLIFNVLAGGPGSLAAALAHSGFLVSLVAVSHARSVRLVAPLHEGPAAFGPRLVDRLHRAEPHSWQDWAKL